MGFLDRFKPKPPVTEGEQKFDPTSYFSEPGVAADNGQVVPMTREPNKLDRHETLDLKKRLEVVHFDLLSIQDKTPSIEQTITRVADMISGKTKMDKGYVALVEQQGKEFVDIYGAIDIAA